MSTEPEFDQLLWCRGKFRKVGHSFDVNLQGPIASDVTRYVQAPPEVAVVS